MTDALHGQSASDTRPGYDEAVEAMARLARAPRCSDWGEGLTEARVQALLDAAYPLVRAGVIAEVVTWLRTCGRWPVTHLGDCAAIAIEREFGVPAHLRDPEGK